MHLTSERCVHLPERVPQRERTTIFPPVVVVDPADVDMRAVRKPESSVTTQSRDLLCQPSGVGRGGCCLSQRRPRQESLRIGRLCRGTQRPPVVSITIDPVRVGVDRRSACQERCGSESHPPPSNRHVLSKRSGRQRVPERALYRPARSLSSSCPEGRRP
jgi:hypothetical protein